MAEENAGGQDRTEQPTPRRWQQARAEGRVARSTELSAAIVMLSGALVFAGGGAAAFGNYATRLFRHCAGFLSSDPMNATGATGILRLAAGGFLTAFLPFAVGVTVLVTLVNVIQARGVFSWSPATPRWSNLSPASGFKRLYGRDAMIQFLKSLIKLAILAVVTYSVLSASLPSLTSLAGCDPSGLPGVIRSTVLRLVVSVGLAFLVLAGFDYAYQVFRLGQSLKMTRQEVLQDLRDSEGDPRVKGRILAMARSLARRRMLQRVPQADVIVVNPTQIAVALKYNLDLAPAPIVLAMGQRKLAERIRTIARQADVPIVENRTVARTLLATAEVGRAIPPALYTAVAEILAFVYRQRRERGLPLEWIGRNPS
jgi:flagellar biosynthetic protein FlhB